MPHFFDFLPDIHTLGSTGYLVLAILIFLESFVLTGMITPGAVYAVIMGGLSAHGYYDYWTIVWICFAMSVLGDGVSYELGRRNDKFLDRFTSLRGPLERTKSFFDKHHGKSVFLGRFFGWTRPIMPFVAGVASMPRARFYIADVITCFLWAVCYIGIGYIFGTAWRLALVWSTRAVLALLIAVVFFMLFAWIGRWIVLRGRPVMLALRQMALEWWKRLERSDFGQRHEKGFRWLSLRLSIEEFTGLPLTVILLLFVVCGGVLFSIAEDVLTGEAITTLDIQLANFLYSLRSSELLSISYAVTLLGAPATLVPAALALSVVLLTQKRFYKFLSVWLSFGCATFITLLATLVSHHERSAALIPALDSPSVVPGSHTTLAVSFYAIVAYIFARRHPLWKVFVSVLLLLILTVVLVALSRMTLGMHYLSDVAMSTLFGLMSMLFAVSITEWRSQGQIQAKLLPFESWMIVAVPFGVQVLVILMTLTFWTAPWTNAAWARKQIALQSSDVQTVLQSLPHARIQTLLQRQELPLNIVLIAEKGCTTQALERSGWNKAEPFTLATLAMISHAILFQEPLPTRPLRPWFYNSLPHDVGFEKVIQKERQQHVYRLRLWYTGISTPNGDVLAGNATVDRRTFMLLRESERSIDAARALVIDDLRAQGLLTGGTQLVPFDTGIVQTVTDHRLAFLTLRDCSTE